MEAESACVEDRRPLSVCTIGDLILDVVVLPDRPLAPDADTPATIRFAAGGQAANVAAWASALGVRSRLICKRGTDVASELAAVELARYGVEICGPVVEGRGGVVASIRDVLGRRTVPGGPRQGRMDHSYVAEDESVTLDDFPDLDGDRRVQDRSGIYERVELAVSAAGINAGREIVEQLIVEPAPRERAVELCRIDTRDDRLAGRGVIHQLEAQATLTPSGGPC
jgi:hypothetical protein